MFSDDNRHQQRSGQEFFQGLPRIIRHDQLRIERIFSSLCSTKVDLDFASNNILRSFLTRNKQQPLRDVLTELSES